jgi:hypothetical protein
MDGCISLLSLHLVSVSCSYAPSLDTVVYAGPIVIGLNITAGRVRVVRKASLHDRSYVSMATDNANIYLGRGWSGWFA